MLGSWVVDAVIRYSGNGVSFMERQAAATNMAAIREAELTGKITANEAAYLRLQNRYDRMATSQAAFGSSQVRNYAMIGAAVGAVAIGDAITQAAKLQRTLIAIRNETGANTAEMGRFYNTVYKIGNIMGVSPATAGDVMLNISRLTAGTMTTAQMQAIAPSVAGFASTINFNRPDVSVEAATQAGIQLAHLFHAWDPAKLEKLMDQVYRLSGLMVETPAQAVRQLSYFVPLFKGLGIDDNTSIAMMALLDRAGFRQKVGTNVRAMMLEELGPLQLTKHYQEGQGKILEQMGIFGPGMKFAWNTKSGGVDYIGMLESVARWAAARRAAGVPREELAKDVYGALGKQGGNIAQLMLDPKVLAVFQGLREYQRNPNVSLRAGEANRQDSVMYQASRVWGNFQADLTELGYRATWVSGTLKDVADGLHNVQEWLHAHRTAESWIGGLAVGVTGLSAMIAAAGVAGKAVGFVAGGLRTVYSASGAAAAGLGGVASALRGVAGAGSAFLTSPLGKVFSGAATFFGTTSFMPQDNARKDLISRYGYDYWRYLKGRHPGTNPYSFDPGSGDMTPPQFRAQRRSAGGPHPTTVHTGPVTIVFPAVKSGAEAAVAIERTFQNPLSQLFSGTPSTKTASFLPVPFAVVPV